MTRREALAFLGALGAAACGAHPPPGAAAPAPPSWRLDPVVDLVPAAGLSWLVTARARELLADARLAPAVAAVLPPERFDAFAASHGGLDLRRCDELAVAGFGDTALAIARTRFEPALVEAAFAKGALAVESRAVEGGVVRFWGSVGAEREQVALLGGEGIAVERGRLGPLRAAIYFAEGKLKRARPALRADPLAAAAALLGDAPVRAFAPGPFAGEWAAGLGGLLGVTTALGLAVTVEPRPAAGEVTLHGRVVLCGAWGDEAPAAAQRLGAAFQLLARDPLGRLLGLDHPFEEPHVSGQPDALRLDVLLDPFVLARGIHAATDAKIAEVMAY
jgi:hypothetical protein